jgi:phospholipid/cholesterol/gamma-HCH transport system permease protein
VTTMDAPPERPSVAGSAGDRMSLPGSPGGQVPPRVPFWKQRGQQFKNFMLDLGGMSTLARDTVVALFRRPFEGGQLIYQIEQMGVRSAAIACVTAIFVGMVMAVQFAFGLERFGARDYVGRIVGLSVTRELAPSLTALVVGSRIGAGMAAELGSMSVTEQIDAIRALGADPVKKLVVPRVLACLLLLPVLTLFADVLGFAGSMVIANVQFGTPMGFFLRTALDSVEMMDFLSGLGKTPFFGVMIAIVGCYYGMHTTGGTEGVGRSTTRTVVVTSVSVFIMDFFLTKFFLSFGPGGSE